jgi:hypothetical protein
MTAEYIVICVYLFAGVCFGLVTFAHRHLFSEGPTKADSADASSVLEGRAFWVLIATWLWPILVLTGINTAFILAKRQKQLKK